MQNNRNFFITIALSVLILMVWQVFYMNPKIEAQRQQAQIEQQRIAEEQAKAGGTAATAQTPATAPAGNEAVSDGSLTLDAALKQTQRVTIDTPALKGSINLKGARFDDIVLKNYREQVAATSPNIHLLLPSGVANGYFAEIGFAGDAAVGTLPGPDSVWTVEGNANLTPATPVTLVFTNDKGVAFKRTIAVDANYLFTVSDSVTNNGTADVALSPYGRITRFQKPAGQSVYVLHEGAVGYSTASKLQEVSFTNLEEDKETKPEKANDGWLGITDKYWASALVPSTKTAYQPRYSWFDDGRSRYQADYLSDPVTVKAGATETVETLFFAGAKEVDKIEGYEKDRAITRFDLK